MQKVTINLYSLKELGPQAKDKAIKDFNSFMDKKETESNRFSAINSLEINGYLFFQDGTMAGTFKSKFELHGETYSI